MKWGFPKIRGTLLGDPIIRIIVFWCLFLVPLFWETIKSGFCGFCKGECTPYLLSIQCLYGRISGMLEGIGCRVRVISINVKIDSTSPDSFHSVIPILLRLLQLLVLLLLNTNISSG